MCCTVSGREPNVASLTVLGKESEEKTGCLSSLKRLMVARAAIKANGCWSIQSQAKRVLLRVYSSIQSQAKRALLKV